MRKYQFVVGVSLPALEEALNRIAEGEHSVSLNQVLHAPGTGFVAVLEHADNHGGPRVRRTRTDATATGTVSTTKKRLKPMPRRSTSG
jgi:hypothetical protein